MKTDDELILSCDRDSDALRELMRRYQAKIYGFLVNMAGYGAADDLFQEVWLKVFKARESYDARGKASSWLFTIARRTALTYLARNAHLPQNASDESLESVPDPAPEPSADAESSDIKRHVNQALSALPHDQREVFLLREMGGMSFKEISEELNIPLGTALSRMNYAIRKLEALLGDRYA